MAKQPAKPALRSRRMPAIAYLIDKNGERHGSIELYEQDAPTAAAELSACVERTTDGKYRYELDKSTL